MNGGSLKRCDTVAKGPWVWGLCSLDPGPGVGGRNVKAGVVRCGRPSVSAAVFYISRKKVVYTTF